MEKELRILMLEDVEEDAGLVERVLKKDNLKFTRLRVDTEPEFHQAIKNFKPDVILSDHALPQFNSIEALKICKENNLDIPFILVTGAVSEEFAVNCLKRGADDYVLKTNLSRLPIAIKNAISNHEQQRQRVEQEKEVLTQNKELIKINKELDAFVYSVSHNLRAPLSSVIGLVHLAKIENTNDDPALLNYLDLIDKSIHRLDETIKDILDYSRNARKEIEIVQINMEALVNTCFEKLKFIKGYTGIERNISVIENAPFYSDKYRITVILGNLFSNALKYKDEKKERCTIEVLINITIAVAEIRIIDNGIGINEDYLPNVFNMFYRATEIGEGSGLGLYIVKETVERLKGDIKLSSNYGQGTAITIRLPNYSKLNQSNETE